MKYLTSILAIVFILFQTACKWEATQSEIQECESINLFNYADITPGIFSDMGAWFGIGFPDENELGIGKPLILSDSNGYFLPEPLIIFSVDTDDHAVHFDIENYSLPGSMYQRGISDDLDIALETIYRDHQTVLIKYQIYNPTVNVVHFRVNWELADFNPVIHNLSVHYDLGNAQMEVDFNKIHQISENIASRDEILNAHDSLTGYIAVRHRFNAEKYNIDNPFIDADNQFLKNNKRWEKYLQSFQNLHMQEQILAAKCIQTLITNWRHPVGELKHAGLFPSYAYRGFHGFWAWDSWKHAVALAGIEPELAKDQIKAMFDIQNKDGMIPDCIFRDTLIEKNNWRNTKPPLSAWAVNEVFKSTFDTAFIIEMLPALIKYHEWWYVQRDHDQNGLCEFGSTDGTKVAAAWESGMDNAVRFDSAEMIFINPNAWSLNQESVDLNSYLYAEKRYLIELAKITGQLDLADKFEKQLQSLQHKIQEVFYNKEHAYFFDKRTTDQSHITVIGPEAWITLWAEVASEEQAKGVVAKIMDSDHFNSYLPFPTLSVSHPEFDPEKGYWRGPVWIDQAYFALEGMKNYGYEKEYEQLKEKLLIHAEGLLERQTPIHENYDPRNGMALNAPHFSWSAAHFLLLLEQEK